MFLSLFPVAPGQVTNVRAYMYRPLAQGNGLTALVVWDSPPGSVVESYTISVSGNGVVQNNVCYA